MTDAPLVNEPSSAAVSSAVAAARSALMIVGGYAIGKGWLEQDTLNMLGTLLITVGPLVYGAYATYWRSRALKAAAPHVADKIINSN